TTRGRTLSLEADSAKPTLPLVSVCIPHRNRAELLNQAIRSIEAQSFTNIEVVLTDDGSDDEVSRVYLRFLEDSFKQKGWKLIRQKPSGHRSARTEAARHARGEYLLFMDDDNLANPDEIETLVKVAIRTDADILTCAFERFSEPSGQPDAGGYTTRWIPL